MGDTGLHWIRKDDPADMFPLPEQALAEPDGLLAAGGDLSTDRLLHAYRRGIFPWYEEGQPVLWWSPDPRCVIPTDKLHISRRTRRALANSGFVIEFNQRFDATVSACAEPRAGQSGTWITADMRRAYRALHDHGWAHSIEIVQHDRLVGGMYGLAIGRCFFGESMFSRAANASKAALLACCQITRKSGFTLLDCQVVSPHLLTLGAELMPRRRFVESVQSGTTPPTPFTGWPQQALPVRELLD